jgi:tetratricopeptide (TPR) repeat protein
MPSNVTGYRVLIELPAGLERERRTFSDTIQAFNESEAIPRDVLFVPVGWDTGAVPAYSSISEELQNVDYLVLLLWDRWPQDGKAKYEFAMECLRDGSFPMARVVAFFKAVSPRQLADPGRQLREVLEFRQQLESHKEATFEAFDQAEDFAVRLRRHLSSWLVRHERSSRTATARETTDAGPDDSVRLARGARAPGRWRPHPLGDGPVDFNEYGLFLQREGMLDEAETVHMQALDLSRQRDLPAATAVAHGNLGTIYQRRGESEKAEQSFHDALEICQRIGWREGMAACYTGLGFVYRPRDMLDHAEEMFRNALEIEKELDRAEGIAACYSHLGLIWEFRGQPGKAEEMRRMAQTVSEEPEYPRGGLFPRHT